MPDFTRPLLTAQRGDTYLTRTARRMAHRVDLAGIMYWVRSQRLTPAQDADLYEAYDAELQALVDAR